MNALRTLLATMLLLGPATLTLAAGDPSVPETDAVTNGGFETDLDGWWMDGACDGSTAPRRTQPGSGSTAGALLAPDHPSAGCYLGQNLRPTGDAYVLAWSARVVAGGPTNTAQGIGIPGQPGEYVVFVRVWADRAELMAFGSEFVASAMTTTADAWHDYRVVVDRTTRSAHLFIDGIPAASAIGDEDVLPTHLWVGDGDNQPGRARAPTVLWDEISILPRDLDGILFDASGACPARLLSPYRGYEHTNDTDLPGHDPYYLRDMGNFGVHPTDATMTIDMRSIDDWYARFMLVVINGRPIGSDIWSGWSFDDAFGCTRYAEETAIIAGSWSASYDLAELLPPEELLLPVNVQIGITDWQPHTWELHVETTPALAP